MGVVGHDFKYMNYMNQIAPCISNYNFSLIEYKKRMKIKKYLFQMFTMAADFNSLQSHILKIVSSNCACIENKSAVLGL